MECRNNSCFSCGVASSCFRFFELDTEDAFSGEALPCSASSTFMADKLYKEYKIGKEKEKSLDMGNKLDDNLLALNSFSLFLPFNS